MLNPFPWYPHTCTLVLGKTPNLFLLQLETKSPIDDRNNPYFHIMYVKTWDFQTVRLFPTKTSGDRKCLWIFIHKRQHIPVLWHKKCKNTGMSMKNRDVHIFNFGSVKSCRNFDLKVSIFLEYKDLDAFRSTDTKLSKLTIKKYPPIFTYQTSEILQNFLQTNDRYIYCNKG